MEELPTPKFQPKLLKIRKKEGDEPIHVGLLWASNGDCGNVDVLYLIEFLYSKGRNCHVNNGVHGKVNADGEFEFVWKGDGSELYRQDFASADPTENNVSLHRIT